MKRQKFRGRRLLAVLSLAVASSVVLMDSATPAVAGDTPQKPELTLTLNADGYSLKDSRGREIPNLAHTDEPGERTMQGETSAGIPVRAVELSALPIEKATPEVASNSGTPSLAGPPEAEDAREHSAATGGFTPEETAFDETLLEPSLAYASTPSTVHIAWAESSYTGSYALIRDGVEVAEISGNGFSESGLPAGSNFMYEIVPTQATTDDSKYITRMMSVSTTPASWPTNDAEMTTQAYQPWATAFMHKTFIPTARVNLKEYQSYGCGTGWSGTVEHGGDDRGFRLPDGTAPWSPPDYRSMMFVNVNWDNPAPYDIVWVKDIGESNLYVDGDWKEARYASMDQMIVEDAYKSGAYAQARFNHQARNPFCDYGAITYNEVVRLYRNGTVEVVGDRYPVPHHEGYMRTDNGSGEDWSTLFRLGGDDYGCLTGKCGYETINFSKTV